ncbi:MAG: TIGR00341 family protein, partial [Macellibacteroides fermentans]
MDKRVFRSKLADFFVRNFDVRQDKEDELETIDTISKGIEFKGTNLWVLIFATFIASLGLNTNSTAVIIGAMLISPLMGPIMGFGVGLGISDFDMIKRSFRNFATATIFSVITSSIYFMISPISEAQSELLARTQPTVYDVLIAFFGGLAGIIASSTKSKGNVIPGVAIATALMPPLCTAGYGIATGNLYYFFGAFYLFFINTVFISVATYLVVRVLKYPKKVFLDKAREKTVHRYVGI